MTDLKAKKTLWLKANDAYNNHKPALMSDAKFDALERQIRAADPSWVELKKTGAPVADKKTEVALVELMPSLLKFYPDKIEKQVAKLKGAEDAILDKLDGSALQIVYERGRPHRAITRGDGTYGGDISFLLPYLKIPKTITNKNFVVLRCEAVMKSKTFARKYAADAENARALVNGALNRQKPSPALKDIDIVVLGVYNSQIVSGLKQAKAMGFDTVRHTTAVVTPALLQKLLVSRRKTSEYDMDGLVIVQASKSFAYDSADKPKWTWAYKENESVADATKTKVKRIIWQDSRNSVLIPKIEIEPVKLGGTTVTFATCHNAQWMLDRKIGPGAVVAIVRSGDVIPKIVAVIKPGKIQLPDVEHEMVGVHFKAVHRSKAAEVKTIQKFFVQVGIEHIAAKTIDKLYDDGFKTALDYVADYGQRLTKMHRAGMSVKMCTKLYAEFERTVGQGLLVKDLMVASNCFGTGIGVRKLTMLEKHYGPEALKGLLNFKGRGLADWLAGAPGWSDKTAQVIIEGLPAFKVWLRQYLKHATVRKADPEKKIKHVLKAKRAAGHVEHKVTFTGYRDATQEHLVESLGYEVVSFSKKTTILIYKEGGKSSTKIDKARDSGIRVMTFAAFKGEFK
jgi:NAD-dependent DNA ligase